MPKPTKTTLSESAFQISSCRKSSMVNSGILSPSSSSDAFLIVIVAVNFTLPIWGHKPAELLVYRVYHGILT